MKNNLQYVKRLSQDTKFQPELQILQQNPQTIKIQNQAIKSFNAKKLHQRINSKLPSRQHFGHSTMQNWIKPQFSKTLTGFNTTNAKMSQSNAKQFNPLAIKSKSVYTRMLSSQKQEIRVRPKSINQISRFNKYYINPDLRYRTTSENPKNDLETLKKEEYLYQNLHNRNFWNWIHPLQGNVVLDQNSHKLSDQVDKKILMRFKSYIQRKQSAKRVPLVVASALEKKI